MIKTQNSECQITHQSGADKICISTQCQLSNPFVCKNCQQAHQHNQSILTVRVNKITDIHKKIQKNSQQSLQIITKLTNLKNSINTIIDKLLKQYNQNQKILTQLNIQLQSFNQSPFGKKFSTTWNHIKSYQHLLQNNNHKILSKCISQLTNQINHISSTTNNQQLNITQSSSSIFLQQFSLIFSYLSLQLKTKPNQNIILQLNTLITNNKYQKKIVAKLFQLIGQSHKQLDIYNGILQDNCMDIQIITKKALLLKKLCKYQQAYDQLTLLLQLLQGKASTQIYHYHRGQVLKQLSRYDQALTQYNKCLDKQSLRSHNLPKSLAQIYLKKANPTQSIPFLKLALQHPTITPKTKQQIYQNLYQCSKLLSDHLLAIQSLTNIYQLQPTNLDIILKRAKQYHQHKQYQKAIQDYTLVINKINNVPGLYYNRAVSYIFFGKTQLSIPDLKKSLQLNPNFKQAVHLLANTCYDLMEKNFNNSTFEHLKNLATNSFCYSLNFYPNNPNIWYKIGVLYSQDNPQKAYQCFLKTIELSPKLAAAYTGKIKMSLKLNINRKTILTDINTAIALGQRNISIFLIKCNIQQQLSLFDQAIQTAQLILKSDPDNQIVMKVKERAIKKTGKKEEEKQIVKDDKQS